MWNQATVASTSIGDTADLWAITLGSGATFIISRASTGMDAGTFCAGISFTAGTAPGDVHQVAAMLAEMKGQVLSFGIRVATATASAVRLYLSTDGGTTRTYGNFNTGAGATTYETLKIEGIAIPTTATAVWFGIELSKTATVLLDNATLNLGSAVDTNPAGPFFPKSAAWSNTSGTTVRNVDMSGTATTLIVQALGTLVRDLQAAGVLQ